MNLRQLIISASAEHASTAEILQAVRKRMKSHPKEINEKGLLNLTACHAAIVANQPNMLEILVLEGEGTLDEIHDIKPEDLACDQHMVQTIGELRKELIRRCESRVFHLHDYIHMLANRPELKLQMKSLIAKRISLYPKEVNERTYWGRTACHWAMYYGLTDLLPLLLKEGKADLSLQDLDAKTPMEVISVSKDESKSAVVKVTATPFSKTDYVELFSEYEEEKASTDLSINYLSDSLSKLKLHHVDHDVQGFVGREKYAEEPLQAPSESNPVKVRENKSKKEKLLSSLSLSEEIKKDNVDFIRQFLEEGNDPNSPVTMLGMPMLHYAFVHAKKRVFRLLLKSGASLVGFAEVLSYRSKNNLRFLTEVRNEFINVIDIRDIKGVQCRLSELEQVFHSKLLSLGLTATMSSSQFTQIAPEIIKNIADNHHLPQNLVQILYEICSCLHSKEKTEGARLFDAKLLSQMIVALLTEYKPSHIALVLKELCVHFSHHQQLVAYFLLKEMMMQDACTPKDVQKYFTSCSVPLFCECVGGEEYTALKSHLSEIITVKQSESMQQLRAYYALEEIVSKHIVYNQDASFLEPKKMKSAKVLANECRALTLQFYHLLNVDEFVDQHWQKSNKETKAPNICQHQRIFDQGSNFIKHQILTAESKKERLAVLTVWIDTITELLKAPLPDYDSAMMIFCSLNHSSILRLKSTFDALDKDTKAALNAADQTLSPLRNFGNMRQLLRENPMSMPFFGLFLRDVTYAYENKNLLQRMFILGPILKDIIHCQNRLKTIHIPLKTDLPFYIRHFEKCDDETLHQLSLRVAVPPLTEKDMIDVEKCKSLLGIYIEKGASLMIESADNIIKGQDAFKELFCWLRDKCQQGLMDFSSSQEILRLAYKTISPSEEYRANPIYFLAPAPAAQFNAQFNYYRRDNRSFVQSSSSSSQEDRLPPQNRHH